MRCGMIATTSKANSGTTIDGSAVERRARQQQLVEDDRGDRDRHPERGEPGAEDVAVAGLDGEQRRTFGCHAPIIQRARRGKRNQTVPLLMLARDPADGARAGAHDDAFGGDAAVLAALDPLEQRAVGDSGRGEDAVALGQVLERVDAVEVLDPPAVRRGRARRRCGTAAGPGTGRRRSAAPPPRARPRARRPSPCRCRSRCRDR